MHAVVLFELGDWGLHLLMRHVGQSNVDLIVQFFVFLYLLHFLLKVRFENSTNSNRSLVVGIKFFTDLENLANVSKQQILAYDVLAGPVLFVFETLHHDVEVQEPSCVELFHYLLIILSNIRRRNSKEQRHILCLLNQAFVKHQLVEQRGILDVLAGALAIVYGHLWIRVIFTVLEIVSSEPILRFFIIIENILVRIFLVEILSSQVGSVFLVRVFFMLIAAQLHIRAGAFVAHQSALRVILLVSFDFCFRALNLRLYELILRSLSCRICLGCNRVKVKSFLLVQDLLLLLL